MADTAAAPTAPAAAVVGLVAKALAGDCGVGLGLVAGGQGYSYLEELRALCADGVPPLLQAVADALQEEIESEEGKAASCWCACPRPPGDPRPVQNKCTLPGSPRRQLPIRRARAAWRSR